MSCQMRQNDIEEDSKNPFRLFDGNNDDFIKSQELRRWLSSLDLNSSPQIIRSMITEADRNRDGKIHFGKVRAFTSKAI
jgi:Ca2+-binding EF-hand superfamily protein